jgi:hypothetical protein
MYPQNTEHTCIGELTVGLYQPLVSTSTDVYTFSNAIHLGYYRLENISFYSSMSQPAPRQHHAQHDASTTPARRQHDASTVENDLSNHFMDYTLSIHYHEQ